jgi:shikimate kinase
MSKVLVLIGGLPGSGKTYLGSEISRNIGPFLDKDAVSRFFTRLDAVSIHGV